MSPDLSTGGIAANATITADSIPHSVENGTRSFNPEPAAMAASDSLIRRRRWLRVKRALGHRTRSLRSAYGPEDYPWTAAGATPYNRPEHWSLVAERE